MDQMLDQAVTRWNLLDHSFYQRWTQGTLTRDELCDYVKQYGHVVRAVPRWLEQVRGGDTAQLARHVEEERSHEALWATFGEALGLTSEAIRTAPANEATARLLARGDKLVEQGQAAAVVWALEAQTPAVARAKLAGLSAFYGISEDTGGKYFAVHEHLDFGITEIQQSGKIRSDAHDAVHFARQHTLLRKRHGGRHLSVEVMREPKTRSQFRRRRRRVFDDYRDRLRGFYFDLAEVAPGPLVSTSEELIATLGDLDGVVAEHRDAYARFRETFTVLEDGHATERVLDLLFPSGEPAGRTTQERG